MSDSSNSSLSRTQSTSATGDRRKRGGKFRRGTSLIARLRKAISKIVRSKSATIGTAIILFWIFIAIAAPIISPYSPTQILGPRLDSPSREHWLGTDGIGRDVLSRVFWGTRVVLLLAPISVLAGLMIGVPLGLISGYVGGRVDMLIMRVCDIIISFPIMLIYILIIVSIGSSPLIVVVSVAIGNVPVITRLVRSLALDERTRD